MRRAPGAGEEALEDGAPRGQLGRRGARVFVMLVGRSALAPDPFTFVIEGRSSVLRKAAKSRLSAGSVQEKSGILYMMTTRSQFVMGFYE